MKKLLLLTALVVVILSGCRKDQSADVEELLKTVPGTTSFVAVADLNGLADKGGDQIRSRLDSMGVAPSVAALFSDGVSLYFTGNLDSADKFAEYAVKKNGGQFVDNNGVKINGNMAYKDNRFWVLVKGRRTIDPETVTEYLALSEAQSFAGAKPEFASMLGKCEKDVEGWMDMNGAMNLASVDFQTRAMARMGLETLFSDGGFLCFSVNFDKGEADAEALVYNSKGKPAKFNFATGKIDMGVFDKLTGNAQNLIALDITSKMVEQLQKQTQGAPSVLGAVLGAMSCVDGTIAVAQDNKALNGVITTDGKNTASLTGMLAQMGMKTSTDGKYVLLNAGEAAGASAGRPVKTLAEYFKGSLGGVVAMNGDSTTPWMEMVALTFKSKDGSVAVDVKVMGKDKDNNILKYILK